MYPFQLKGFYQKYILLLFAKTTHTLSNDSEINSKALKYIIFFKEKQNFLISKFDFTSQLKCYFAGKSCACFLLKFIQSSEFRD